MTYASKPADETIFASYANSFDFSYARAEDLFMQAPVSSGNYIHSLQMTIREQHVQLVCIRNSYESLVQYLCSSKFDNDPTVQVRDVLNRLNEINYQTMGPDSKLIQQLCKPVIATGEITSL